MRRVGQSALVQIAEGRVLCSLQDVKVKPHVSTSIIPFSTQIPNF